MTMSRTTKMKFAGACVLAMMFGTGALAHGGGISGGSMGSHVVPPPGINRPTTQPHNPTVSDRMPSVGVRQPVTGTRLPNLNDRTPNSGSIRPDTGSDGVQVDPPSGE
jgi:hypothetical protein